MNTVTDIIRQISFSAIIVSVILLLLPNAVLARSAKKAIIFIMIVFIIMTITFNEINLNDFVSPTVNQNTANLLGEVTEQSIITQLESMLNAKQIYFENITVDWSIDKENKIEVKGISLGCQTDRINEVKSIIKTTYNISGEVYAVDNE